MSRNHQAVRAAITSCTSCELHKTGNGPVSPTGVPGYKLMVMGQNPGEQEDKGGKPFIGPAGQLLRGLMAEVGLEPSKTSWANCVACWSPNNRLPSRIETMACGRHRLNSILAWRPEVVLLAGEYALQVFKPKLKLSWMHGRFFEWAPGQAIQGVTNDLERCVTFAVTYHPAGALYGRDQTNKTKEVIKGDLMNVLMFLEGRLGYVNTCVVCGREGEHWEEDGVVYCGKHYEREQLKLFTEEG